MSCCSSTDISCSSLDVTLTNVTEELLTLSVYDLQGKGTSLVPILLQPMTSFTKNYKQNDMAIESLIMDGISDILSAISLVIDPSVLGALALELALCQTFIDGVDWDSTNGCGCFGNIIYTDKDSITGQCKSYISYFSCIQNYCLFEAGDINVLCTNFYYYDGKTAELLKKFNTKDICFTPGSYDNNSGCVTIKIINENEICNGFKWNNNLSFCGDETNQCWLDLLKSKKQYIGDSEKGWYDDYSFNKFIDCQKKTPEGCYQATQFDDKSGDEYIKIKQCQYNCPFLYKDQDICDPNLAGVSCFSDNGVGICQPGLCPVKQVDGSYRCNEKKQDTICDSLPSCTPIKYTGKNYQNSQKDIGRYTTIDRYTDLQKAKDSCSPNYYCQGVVQDNITGDISTAKRIFMEDNKKSIGNPPRYNLFLKSELTPTTFGTWYSNDWTKANNPYSPPELNLPYDQCLAGCEADPNCRTMTGFRTSPTFPSRPCAYYDTVIPNSSIKEIGSSWDGSVSYRKVDPVASGISYYNTTSTGKYSRDKPGIQKNTKSFGVGVI